MTCASVQPERRHQADAFTAGTLRRDRIDPDQSGFIPIFIGAGEASMNASSLVPYRQRPWPALSGRIRTCGPNKLQARLFGEEC